MTTYADELRALAAASEPDAADILRGERVLVCDEADLPQTFATYRHADDRHSGPSLVPLFVYASGDLCAC